MKHFSVSRMFKKITDLITHVLVNMHCYHLFTVFNIPKQPTKISSFERCKSSSFVL